MVTENIGLLRQKEHYGTQCSIMHRSVRDGLCVSIRMCDSAGHHSETAYVQAHPGSTGLNCMENIDTYPEGQ